MFFLMSNKLNITHNYFKILLRIYLNTDMLIMTHLITLYIRYVVHI